MPPAPPTSTPPAPFFVDYDKSSITFGFAAPEGITSPLFHIQMRSVDVGVDESKKETDDLWTTISQKFSSTRVKKKNLEAGAAYSFRYRVRDSIDYLKPWSHASEAMTTLPPGFATSPTPRLKKSEAASVTLMWDHAPDEVTTSGDFLGYEVSMRLEDAPFEVVGKVRNNEVKKKNLDHTRKYYFRVRVAMKEGTALAPHR